MNKSPETQNEIAAAYMRRLESVTTSCTVTNRDGAAIALDSAVRDAGQQMRAVHERGNRLFFIGNGGSAGISSHMATDYSKNGGMRSTSLTDGSTLTCLGNDYGYEHVFEKQLEWHARAGDLL